MSLHRWTLRALIPIVLAAGVALPAASASAEPTAAEVKKQIEVVSAKLEKAVETYNKTNIDLTATKKAITDLRATLGPLADARDAARGKVATLASTAYTSGGLTGLNVLLGGAGQADTLMDRLATLEVIARDQADVLASSVDAGARYDSEKTRLDAVLATQTTQFAQITAQKKQIEADLAKLEDQKRKIGIKAAGGTPYSGTIPDVSGKAGIAVRYAYNAIGTPYVWAADGPDGYDCSGLTKAAWRAAGVTLYHYVPTQWDEVAHIKRSQLAPGDLVFYSGLGHVALYVGNGKVIHAPTFGEVVKISSVDMMTPYGFGRVRT
ncbi:cell wall-associated NlpC family hydrolase [Allocatelliglobosispora scoriae]|uniref:Cell wall-associated NlpC family hydrolase n=1 Tax=Allocatelliglobosispora scoriae TaxID=643052 RepID=A0A841BZ96_9ACTN|nr:NlpC/P60 family protein [Allocatelliglobosispora scoriae]MBB5872122.1 cell wall-associated NlpC family hydrolase [Allocatelliglobosispora scoriae]